MTVQYVISLFPLVSYFYWNIVPLWQFNLIVLSDPDGMLRVFWSLTRFIAFCCNKQKKDTCTDFFCQHKSPMPILDNIKRWLSGEHLAFDFWSMRSLWNISTFPLWFCLYLRVTQQMAFNLILGSVWWNLNNIFMKMTRDAKHGMWISPARVFFAVQRHFFY